MDNEENEVIDLTEILSAVRQHLLELIFVTLAAALIGFTASKFLMTPKYDSSALMIVNTRQDVNANVTSDQINSATKLVSTYSIIIKSDTVLQQVIDNLGLNLTYAKLNKRVTVAAVDDTQVMKITVQSDSPEWARQVCEQIITVAPDVIKEAVEAGADIIMLDNMTTDQMRAAIDLIDGRAETECSGNVTKENIESLISLGVDYISSGALTHSSPIMDISMKNLHAEG